VRFFICRSEAEGNAGSCVTHNFRERGRGLPSERRMRTLGGMKSGTRKLGRGLLEWADGKPNALVWTAIMAACQADSIYAMLRQLRSGKLHPPDGVVGSSKAWLRMYRRTRSMRDVIGGLMGFDDAVGMPVSVLLAELNRVARRPVEELRAEFDEMDEDEKHELFRSASELRNQLLEETLSAAIEESLGEENAAGESTDLSSHIEVWFFGFVWFPCWIEYQEVPSRLLRKARNGDVEALDKLLRIDKSIIADPRILEQFHEAAHAQNQGMFRRIAAALASYPDGQFRRSRLKTRIAGLISLMFKAADKPISEREVRELFDRIVQIRGDQIETDLPDSPEALARAMLRAGDEWQKAIPAFGQK
jgi:hypothetical protein